MKRYGYRRNVTPLVSLLSISRTASLSMAILWANSQWLSAQTGTATSVPYRIQQLTDAMTRAEAQIQETQHQLEEMRRQLKDLQQQVGQNLANHQAPPSSSEIEELRERQDIQQSEIATHEQTKVESESKYPVKITGLLLLSGVANTSAVNSPSTPAVSVGGPGSTAMTLRQTVLGLDAHGPHLLGAESYADLRVDFSGSESAYNGYSSGSTNLLRLRTAHAGLEWQHTKAYFSLDRPVFSPDSPASVVAIAEPALAWSGNLWTWNPQLGITQDLPLPRSHDLRLQAALIDVGDPPVSSSASSTGGTLPSAAEQSRWPGVEARIALLSPEGREMGNHFGLGGYFAPHDSFGTRYNAWAGTLDARFHLPAGLQLSGSFYRGLALGGLGGGAYKDFVYYFEPYSNTHYLRPLSDVGGWAQLQEKISERLQFNTAVGFDNVFARELRPYATQGDSIYKDLARNRTYLGNVIYSPSAYLLFSLEYRRLTSFPVIGPASRTNIIGVAAGYKF